MGPMEPTVIEPPAATCLRLIRPPPDTPATAVEYVTASISAISLQEQIELAVQLDPLLQLAGVGQLVPQLDSVLYDSNPHYRYVKNLTYGLAVVDVDRDSEIRVSFVHVPDVRSAEMSAPVERLQFRTPAGTSEVQSA